MHLVGSRQKKLDDFCKRMAVTIFQNYMMKVEKELGVFNLGGKKRLFSYWNDHSWKKKSTYSG